MSDSDIRANIESIMKTVSNIGNIYKYTRLAQEASDLSAITKFEDALGERVLFWEITKTNFDVDNLGMGSDDQHRADRKYRITGYHGVDDLNNSEQTFHTLVEAVVFAFANNQLKIGAPVFNFPNRANKLDDLSTLGIVNETEKKELVVQITTAAVTDKFKVSVDGGVTFPGLEIDITGNVQEITGFFGVNIEFGAITGHVVGDEWAITVLPIDMKPARPEAKLDEAMYAQTILCHRSIMEFLVEESVASASHEFEELNTINVKSFLQEPTPPDDVVDGESTISV